MTPVVALLLAIPLFGGTGDVEQLIERLRSEEPSQRHKAQEELIGLGASAVPAMIRALDLTVAAPQAEIARLIHQLGSESWKEREQATSAIVRLGRPAIPVIEGELRAADAEQGWRLRSAVSEILDKAGQDESLSELRAATLCDVLAQSGDGRAVTPILRLLSGPGADRQFQLRLRASIALGQLRPAMSPAQADEAADHVLEVFEKAPGPLEKALLLKTLGRLRAPAAIRPLTSLLLDRSEKNVHLKRSCMVALAEIGGPRGLRSVVESLDSDDVYIREGAASVLREQAGDAFGFDPRATPEENRASIGKFRAWGASKYGAAWGE